MVTVCALTAVSAPSSGRSAKESIVRLERAKEIQGRERKRAQRASSVIERLKEGVRVC